MLCSAALALGLSWCAPPPIATSASPVAPELARAVTTVSGAADRLLALPILQRDTPNAVARVEAALRDAAVELAGSEAMGQLRAVRSAQAHLYAVQQRVTAARIAAAAGGRSGDEAGWMDSALRSLGMQRTGAEASDPDPIGRPEREAREALDRALDELAARLAAIGVPLGRDAVESIAAASEGETLVAMAGVYANVERVTASLREALRRAPDSEPLIRRYYALHAASLGILAVVQQEARERIIGDILPRLPRFEAEARALKADAERRLGTAASPDERAELTRSIEANVLVLEVIALYRSHLERLAAALAAQAEETTRKRGIAENTARTAALALDVAAMLRDTERDLSAVLSARPGLALPFEAIPLRREFERLSRRMAEG